MIEQSFSTEVMVAIVGGIVSIVGTIVAAIITIFKLWQKAKIEKHGKEQAEMELRFQSQALDFNEFMASWSDTEHELKELMDEGVIDRFLILRAWNGYLKPRWTSAIFQMRGEGQGHYSYVHFELDDDYVDRLRAVENSGCEVYTERDMRGLIKDVYTNEGVKSSAWFHLQSKQVVDSKCRAVTYCSFSSRTVKELDERTVLKCRMISGRLKGIAMAFKDGDDHAH